ncbi:MAG: hypothetical protein JWM02_2560 [Frankiales bacterium]|nr:hypothetical protein [Frankiales bacterium]
MRALVVLVIGLAVSGIAVPMAWGIHFHLAGLAQAAAGSALLVTCSALALNGSRVVPLSAQRAVPAVLATTAANAVTPAGIGGTVLVLRIHRRSGLSAEQAGAAAGLRTAAGALVATATTAVVASTVGMSELPAEATGLRIALPALAAITMVALAVPKVRRKLVGSTVQVALAVSDVVRRPRCLASLLIGCAGVTVAQLLTLQGAVHAVGGHVPWVDLLVALMGSAAARSAVPSPGGVGPIEAALIGGLTALGLGLGTATAAVAVYRTAGHWLPVLAGVISIRELRRRQLL